MKLSQHELERLGQLVLTLIGADAHAPAEPTRVLRRRSKTAAMVARAKKKDEAAIVETLVNPSRTIEETVLAWHATLKPDDFSKRVRDDFLRQITKRIGPSIGKVKLAEFNKAHLAKAGRGCTSDDQRRRIVRILSMAIGSEHPAFSE